MSNSKWLPLKSDPDLMNSFLKELGVSDDYAMSDVISLDEDHLDEIPSPAFALILLFPLTEKYKEYQDKQEENKEKSKNESGVYYMKQTVDNICGTIALIHAVANSESHLKLKPDSVMKKFLDATKELSPEDKGKRLEEDEDIKKALESSIKEGESPNENSSEEERNHHFIAIVNVDGKLFELDGKKPGPVEHGDTSEERFLRDASRICREYIKRDPDNFNFTVLSFGAK